MYQNKTFDEIMNSMLSTIPSSFDTREGSIIWDALAPSALELANLYVELDTILNETFADTASMYYLERRAAERGIYPFPATKAILKAEITLETGVSPDIIIGDRFTSGTLFYTVIEHISDNYYKIQCDEYGKDGNRPFGQLSPVQYGASVRTAEIVELLIAARDDETVDEFRQRYIESVSSQAFGGNVADYENKVMQIGGVGGVKVTPTISGGGTVGITVMGADNSTASPDLILKVKNALDPSGQDGFGYGLAPIGHIVEVSGVETVDIDITTNITFEDGWNWTSAQDDIDNAMKNYINELCSDWQNQDNVIVRISQIESRLLSLEAVKDIGDTEINDDASNLALESDEIPKFKSITSE